MEAAKCVGSNIVHFNKSILLSSLSKFFLALACGLRQLVLPYLVSLKYTSIRRALTSFGSIVINQI